MSIRLKIRPGIILADEASILYVLNPPSDVWLYDYALQSMPLETSQGSNLELSTYNLILRQPHMHTDREIAAKMSVYAHLNVCHRSALSGDAKSIFDGITQKRPGHGKLRTQGGCRPPQHEALCATEKLL